MAQSQIKKYTAFVPRTLKASKNMGKIAVKRINYFLRNTAKKIKKTTKMLDRRTAKSIRSLTKKQRR
jgi:RNase P subunit RPR2